MQSNPGAVRCIANRNLGPQKVTLLSNAVKPWSSKVKLPIETLVLRRLHYFPMQSNPGAVRCIANRNLGPQKVTLLSNAVRFI